MKSFDALNNAGAAPATVALPEIDDNGENPRRPVDEKEEFNDTLPPRSPQRIAYLLATHEEGRLDLTEIRIRSDKMRWRNAHPEKPYVAAPVSRNPQANITEC